MTFVLLLGFALLYKHGAEQFPAPCALLVAIYACPITMVIVLLCVDSSSGWEFLALSDGGMGLAGGARGWVAS